MPQAQNVEAVGAFFARVMNAPDASGLEALTHRDVVVPQGRPGVEGFRALVADMKAPFADGEYKVVDTVSEGEKVVVRFSGKATHSGRFMGIPATGRALKLWGVMIFRFEAGAIAEFWGLLDAQSVLKQLREP